MPVVGTGKELQFHAHSSACWKCIICILAHSAAAQKWLKCRSLPVSPACTRLIVLLQVRALWFSGV